MNNKKIGLAINYDYHDYGGMLQAFATQKALELMGYQTEVINFDNLKVDINKRKWKYFLSNILDISIVREKEKVLEKKIKTKFNGRLIKNQYQRDSAFDSFCKANFVVSRKYEDWADLNKACNDYISVIVGSDQLWLPSNVMANYYTLSFVPDEVNKVCYATSFGIGEIPVKYENHYRFFLNRINFLSARETSGQAIIKKITGRDVPLVCDPTILLETKDWDITAGNERLIKDKYVFCYFMGDNPEQRTWARKLADKYGYKVVSLIHLDQYIKSDELYVDNAPYNVSPAGFVNLVKNAEYVCTDSFHGTVFSIIYSKDFFTFRRFNKNSSLSTNTRIYSLLDRLNLSNRLFTAEESLNQDLHIHNYEEIQSVVCLFRDHSKAYLMSALEI